ncbi:Zinc finger C2H2 protein [Astathelohania contejeani]|uniref:Zinc finger C2H2 protein n=1 Tax=Astathelohania contejeani TaxID=164912 RepID=A0ABQ7HZP5_9MICR|nr:Zinc finger C2H2 protein [Thelohania contejeani]
MDDKKRHENYQQKKNQNSPKPYQIKRTLLKKDCEKMMDIPGTKKCEKTIMDRYEKENVSRYREDLGYTTKSPDEYSDLYDNKGEYPPLSHKTVVESYQEESDINNEDYNRKNKEDYMVTKNYQYIKVIRKNDSRNNTNYSSYHYNDISHSNDTKKTALDYLLELTQKEFIAMQTQPDFFNDMLRASRHYNSDRFIPIENKLNRIKPGVKFKKDTLEQKNEKVVNTDQHTDYDQENDNRILYDNKSVYDKIDSDIFPIYETDDGKKKYGCPYRRCKKEFPSLSRIKRHYIVHTGIKPFPCLNPECNKTFSRKDNMLQHYRCHCTKYSRKTDE